MNSMDASKRFVPTQEFKDLEANIAKTESAYAKLEEKQKALEAAGKATVPSADYSEVKAHYDDAQARLEKLIAKQREWLDLGFKPGFGHPCQYRQRHSIAAFEVKQFMPAYILSESSGISVIMLSILHGHRSGW